jgi:hypothetical protein
MRSSGGKTPPKPEIKAGLSKYMSIKLGENFNFF